MNIRYKYLVIIYNYAFLLFEFFEQKLVIRVLYKLLINSTFSVDFVL